METVRSAPASGPDRPNEEATFTKWMVGDGPDMAGIVGGAVGDGTYSGKVLEYSPGPTQVITARYSFHGAERSFSALVQVEQTDLDANILGVITDGWRKGDLVRGGYRQVQCQHDGVTTDCWQGSITVVRN